MREKRFKKIKTAPIKTEKGIAAIVSVLIITGTAVAIAFALTFILLNEIKIIKNTTKTNQSYYASEAGLEDALYRVKSPDLIYPEETEYTINVGDSTTTVLIDLDDIIGEESVEITSTGNMEQRINKLQVNGESTTRGMSFVYGVQSDDYGFQLNNNATIIGNVYTNQNIVGQNKNTSKVTGDAIAVGSISTITVGTDAENHDAWANSFSNCVIKGEAKHANGAANFTGCTAITELSNQATPTSEDLPYVDTDFWQSQAANGGEIAGPYTPPTGTFGPVKISGDLTIGNGTSITLQGPTWVTGNLNIETNSTIDLDDSWGENGTVIIVDGTITVQNNTNIIGTPQNGYILLISTKVTTPSVYAIDVRNNSDAGIFYAMYGMVNINNNVIIKEVTGRGITVANNASVQYDSGLANKNFSSGPSGGFSIESWREIE